MQSGAESLETRLLLTADFGDAPLPYPTTLAEGGAQHAASGLTLGATRDAEADGTHSAAADADGADEDGITFGTLVAGDLMATVTVNVQGAAGKLDAWIDFNGDGSWGGMNERIFVGQAVAVGDNVLTFSVPSTARSGSTYARFRLSTSGGLSVGGSAVDGEVEDYQVTIAPPVAAGGVFVMPTNVDTGAKGAIGIFAADLDGDGDLDALGALEGDDTVAWYENDGSQNFTKHTISTTASLANSVLAADVDGDGDLDVLSTAYGDQTISWYENDGSQNFSAHVIASSQSGIYDVYAADVDGDGDLDVLGAVSNANRIVWFENDGSQNFTSHTITASAQGVRRVAAADVDGDGDVDVISASSQDGTIAWYENDGSQSFTTHTLTTTATLPIWIDAVDLDHDGDLDILSAEYGDDTIAWYENDGDENFTARTITTAADGARRVYAVDVDGDGDFDVLTASTLDDTIAWFENDGNQNFTSHTITNSANGVWGIYPADVDGDGDLDVFSASYDAKTIAWYENLNLLTVEFSGDSIAENGGNLQGTVTRLHGDMTQPLVVTLVSDDPTEASVPVEVTIPANHSSVNFSLTAVDDPLVDGTQTVTISASAGGFVTDTATVDVTDHEIPLEMISPSGITDDMTPELTWNSVGGAARYEIWVRDLTRKVRVADQDNILTTSYTPDTPWNGTNYRVWVRAFSAAGEAGPWSNEDFRFSIRNAPQITAPTIYRTTDSTPTLEWDPIPDTQWGTPESFEVWIKRHRSKYAHVVDIAGPDYTTDSLPIGRYNFWVRGILPGGLESGWSRAREVVIVTPPTLTGPTGTVGTLTPTITWDALPGASTYELYISDVTGGQAPLLQPNGIVTSSWTVTQPLTSGHAYKVWARAYDEFGWRGYYGDPIEFNVADVWDGQRSRDPEADPETDLQSEVLLVAGVTADAVETVVVNSGIKMRRDSMLLARSDERPVSVPSLPGSPSAAFVYGPNQTAPTPADWPRDPSMARLPQRLELPDSESIRAPFGRPVGADPASDESEFTVPTAIDRALTEWAVSDLAFVTR